MSETFSPGDTLTISTASYKRRRFTVESVNFGPATRAVLRGTRGAQRVLAKIGPGAQDWWIREDDGERNRGRPCTVESNRPPVEGPMSSVSMSESADQLREAHWPDGWHWSSADKSVAVGPRGRDIDSVWVHEKRRRGKPPHIETPVGGCDSVPVSVVESVIWHSRRRESEEAGPRGCMFGGETDARTVAAESFTLEATKPAPRKHYPITAMDLARLMRCEAARDVAEWVFDRDVSHSCVTNDPHTTDTSAAIKLYLSSLEVLRTSAEAGE